MARQTEFIQLSNEERRSLKTLFSGGNGSNRQHNRARILDLLDKQTTPPQIARLLDCSPTTVYNVKRRYTEEGLEQALTERARTGKPPVISGTARAA
jgi:transposase